MEELNDVNAWKILVSDSLKGKSLSQSLRDTDLEGIQNGGLYWKCEHGLPEFYSWPEQVTYSRVSDAPSEVEEQLLQDKNEGMAPTLLMAGSRKWDFYHTDYCEYLLEHFDTEIFKQACKNHKNLYVDVNGMDFANLSDDIKYAKDNGAFFIVNGARLHNAGATIIQEFSYVLNFAQKLFEHGVRPGRIKFLTALDSQYFLSIAKVRSLRCLLEELFSAWEFTDRPFIMSMSSLREQTLYDPWSNLLRNNTSAMAAILGGSNHVLIRSYDALFSLLTMEKTSGRAIRSARQNLNVLRYESKLDQVKDTTRGSFAIENMSVELVTKGWESFLNWKEKGILENICDFSTAIEAVAKVRQERVEKRQQAITGVSEFANPEETMQQLYGRPWSPLYLTRGLFPLRRNAAKYEKLRLKIEMHQIKSQTDYTVAILTEGQGTQVNAQVNFIQNLFEILGLNVKWFAWEDFQQEDFQQEESASCAQIVVYCPLKEQSQLESYRHKSAMYHYIYDAGEKDSQFSSLNGGEVRFGPHVNAYKLLEDLLVKEGILS